MMTNKHLEDDELLPAVVKAVQAAGTHMLSLFSIDARRGNQDEVLAAVYTNDDESLSLLRPALEKARPVAGWVDDELGSGELPPGEWWVTDAVEGNINHIHGMTEWGISATLVRNNLAVLTVVYVPIAGNTYTAMRGSGAYLDGVRLHPSTKTDLKAALVGTGQAKPGEDSETYRRIGQSVTAMLGAALVVRVSVPATLQLIHIAAGRMDIFWQHSSVRSGLLAGALLVEEAGGTLTDAHGHPWSLTSDDFLATAPGLHTAAVAVLSTIV
jgi:myo-inositol-1(or 4)-monophosphatase